MVGVCESCGEGGESRGRVFDDLQFGKFLQVKVLKNFKEGGVWVSLANTVVDVGEKGSGNVNPIVAVQEVFVVVAEAMWEVFVDSLECMVVCSSDVGRWEVTWDYGVGGNWVDRGDGLFYSGYGEARGAVDVAKFIY